MSTTLSVACKAKDAGKLFRLLDKAGLDVGHLSDVVSQLPEKLALLRCELEFERHHRIRRELFADCLTLHCIAEQLSVFRSQVLPC